MMEENQAYQENSPFYKLLATKYDQEKGKSLCQR